jgi:hypothetical protein
MACGPDFPWQLLSNRTTTLKNTPANSFAFDAARLVVPTDTLQAIETEESRKSAADTRPVTEEQGEPVPVCVSSACYDCQSSLQFLLCEHFRLRHSPNPSFDKRNITFARFWWATGNGRQDG